MGGYRLEHIFAPRGAALVGAGPGTGSLGHAALANPRRANPQSAPFFVNPAHTEIDGIPFSSI